MAQQRTIKNILRFPFSSSAWCAAFVPDGNGIQWAVIQESSKGPVLHGYGFATSPEEALHHIRGVAADTIYLASVLPSIHTLCRQLSLPPLQAKEVQAAIVDTLEQTVSMGIGESVIAYESYANEDRSLTITAYLAKQSFVQEHLSYLNTLSIDPEWTIPKAACLAAFLSHFSFNGWNYGIDIGADETTAVLIFNGTVIESRSFVGGSASFIALDQPSPENDEQLRHFLQHLTEAVLAYKERYGLEADIPLTVTGSVLSFQHADTVIAEFVRAPLSALHATADNTPLLQCAAAVGAAFLTQPKNSGTPIPTFRINEFAFPRPLLHWKRPLVALGLGCLAAALAIVWYGASQSSMIIEEMRNDWKTITAVAHTTPEEVSLQTAQTLGSMESLSPEHLLAMGNWLLTTVDRQTSYPLHPDIPRMTDTISWLSLQIADIAKATPPSNEKFEIQTLHYQLVKHPTKNHPKERYQVRVDIEFLTPSVALARAFHERLVNNNTLVDNTSEVKWTPSNGKYRASFFLKDKTLYPQQQP